MNRVVRLALALTVSVGAQAVYAMPARALAELRAVSCCAKQSGHARCAKHCDHPRQLRDAVRCCGVGQQQDVQAVPHTPARTAGPDLGPALPAIFSAGLLPVRSTDWLIAHGGPGERAGPIFLLTRSLLL